MSFNQLDFVMRYLLDRVHRCLPLPDIDRCLAVGSDDMGVVVLFYRFADDEPLSMRAIDAADYVISKVIKASMDRGWLVHCNRTHVAIGIRSGLDNSLWAIAEGQDVAAFCDAFCEAKAKAELL